MTAAHIIHNIKEGRKEGDSAHKNDASTPQIALASPISATNRHKIIKSKKPDKFPITYILHGNHTINLVK